jgi:outer membrane protein assembly factor BamB
MFRRNPEHLGYIDEQAGARGGVQWIFDTESKKLRSSPAVADGLVFIGSGNEVYALKAEPENPEGEIVWKYSTSGNIPSSPAIAGKLVFITSMDGYIYALKQHPSNPPGGELVWRYQLGDFSRFTSSPTVYDDLLFVGSEVGYLYCLKADTRNPEGELVWKYPLGGWMHGTPAVSENKVFIGNSGPLPKQGYQVSCLNAKSQNPDGELLWKFKVGSKPWGVGTSPAVDSGKVLRFIE